MEGRQEREREREREREGGREGKEMPFVPSLQPPPSSLLPLPLSERTVYLLLPGRGLL
jgi:hypothetical protein